MATDRSPETTDTEDDAQRSSRSNSSEDRGVGQKSVGDGERIGRGTVGLDDPYEIRRYESRDRDRVLELYDLVDDRDDDWFRWKYEENPFTDRIPIGVATVADEIVAVNPWFALEMRVGHETRIGFQPADRAIHPDYRECGLHSRFAASTTDRLVGRDPPLHFAFQNRGRDSRGDTDWSVVSEVPTFFRFQGPDAIGDTCSLGWTLASPFVSAYLRARESLVSVSPDVTVDRFDDVPVETFVDLYERAIPRTIHANRDAAFYDWRFENPAPSVDGYVATRYGSPVAGVVTATRIRRGTKRTELVEAVPLHPADGRIEGLSAIVARVLEDRRDADVVTTWGETLPETVLDRFGFLADRSIPLATGSAGSAQAHLARPLENGGGHEWTVAGLALTDPSNWTVTAAANESR